MALTASPDAQRLLLDVQALDTTLQQLAHRERSLPERAAVETLKAEADVMREFVIQRRGELEDARIELGRVESDVAVVEARIARDGERLQASSSVKDIAGLEHELESLRARLGDLEEIELSVMEKVEALESELASATASLDAHQQQLEQAEAARDAALSVIADEVAAARSQRAAIVATVPADLLALYEKQRERYGVGASHLRARVSSASGVELTGSDLATVRAAAPDAVLLCPDSNAILVRTDESGL
ncbi:zinc ribbon domain-containing protein [Microcella sp.]|uniref:zinc ribbon domain-containing protein n=1 Tax=Microcella sp. TaxID=1913979 RepID=UPI003F6EE4C6